MKRLFLTIAALIPLSLIAKNVEHTLLSPDENYEFTFYHEDISENRRELSYSVAYKGELVVEKSQLGVLIENQLFESALAVPNEEGVENWCENLRLIGVESSSVDSSWQPIYGERAEVQDRYNEMDLKFEKGEIPKESIEYNRYKSYFMDIEVRAYNEGVAFRYHFPEATNGLFIHITGEQTNFTMPKGTLAYFEKWAQGPYELRPLSGWGEEQSERPLTLKLPSGTYVSLTEAQMVDYARGKFSLSKDRESTLDLTMYDCADIITPYNTPWRVIMAAQEATELLNNNDIILNLNAECQIEDTKWINPGKVFRCGLTQEEVMAGIDFASQRGYQYVHFDAGWYGPEMKVASDARKESEEKNLNIKALCDYASTKGMGVFLYVNQRALATQLDEILPIYKEWGVKGMKFGFVHIGNQMWSTWLHDAIRKCAEYEILVDIHDEYRPTGFSRTYPNLMTQEGIRGNEEMPDATHNTILPFTRYIAGAGDYTFAYFDRRIKNTKAHQLTLPIIYYSPLQFMHWYDTPNRYSGEETEMALWSTIPTVWDYSRALEGEVGEYIIQSRRSGDEWFVGAITNTEAREVEIDLSQILVKGEKYIVNIYEDDPTLTTKTKVKVSQRKVKYSDSLKFKLQPSGGVALHITPASNSK